MQRIRSLPPLYAPLFVAPFVLLSGVLFTGKALFWGTPFLQFVPWRWQAWQMIRLGYLPLWNPLAGMGAPLAANYQSALFYPPNWLLFLLAELWGVGGLAWGQGLLAALHFVWAGLGMALLSRRLGLGSLPQAVSGLAFGLSAYLVDRSGFLSINAAVAWVPWVILMVDRLAGWQASGRAGFPNDRRGRFSSLVGCSIVIALQLLAGHAQTAWYTLLLAGLWAGFVGWRGSQPRRDGEGGSVFRRVTSAWFWLGVAVMLALALSAVQLLPTLEYLQQSQRVGSVGYDFAMTYSFWPWRFLTLLAPDLFGSPAHGDYWGYGNYWEDALYIGLLPLVMAVSAIVMKKRLYGTGGGRQGEEKTGGSDPPPVANFQQTAFNYFLALIALVSFALALGKNTPLFPWLYRHVPTFDMFQGPTRFSLWAEFALALLAGFGVDAWRRPTGRGLYWARLGTAGAVAVLFGAAITASVIGSSYPTFIRAASLAGIWGVGVGILTLSAPIEDEQGERTVIGRKKARILLGAPMWSWAVILVVAVDLLSAGWNLNPGIDFSLYTQPAVNVDEVRSKLGGGRLYLPNQDEYSLKFDRFFTFRSFEPVEGWDSLPATLLPNTFLLDGLPSVNNFDPLVPGRYSGWMVALERAAPQQQARLLNLMGVGAVERVEAASESGVRFYSVQGGSRLRWVPCALQATSFTNSLQQVLEEQIDLDRRVIVEGLEDGPGLQCPDAVPSAPPPAADIQLTSDSPDRIVIHLSTAAAGWLVVSDTWFPGWRAWVDGQAARVRPGDALFRAVAVPAGEHEVILAYRPVSFYSGMAITAMAMFGLFIYFLLIKRVTGRQA